MDRFVGQSSWGHLTILLRKIYFFEHRLIWLIVVASVVWTGATGCDGSFQNFNHSIFDLKLQTSIDEN